MNFVEQINKAVASHGRWKAELAQVVSSGVSKLDPSAVARDDLCEFGKWLYKDVAVGQMASPHYEAVVRYHADFHKHAAQVLRLALEGKREEAKQAMSKASEFDVVSTALTAEMVTWKRNRR